MSVISECEHEQPNPPFEPISEINRCALYFVITAQRHSVMRHRVRYASPAFDPKRAFEKLSTAP